MALVFVWNETLPMERPQSMLVGWMDEDPRLHYKGEADVVGPGGSSSGRQLLAGDPGHTLWL